MESLGRVLEKNPAILGMALGSEGCGAQEEGTLRSSAAWLAEQGLVGVDLAAAVEDRPQLLTAASNKVARFMLGRMIHNAH